MHRWSSNKVYRTYSAGLILGRLALDAYCRWRWQRVCWVIFLDLRCPWPPRWLGLWLKQGPNRKIVAMFDNTGSSSFLLFLECQLLLMEISSVLALKGSAVFGSERPGWLVLFG